jgi:hypothetical protein
MPAAEPHRIKAKLLRLSTNSVISSIPRRKTTTPASNKHVMHRRWNDVLEQLGLHFAFALFPERQSVELAAGAL